MGSRRKTGGAVARLLTEPAAMVEPLCVGVGKDGKPSGVPDGLPSFQTRYNVYVPDIDTMKRYRNRSFAGYWPKRADEAGRILNTYASSPISVVFGRAAPDKVAQLIHMKSVCAIS